MQLLIKSVVCFFAGMGAGLGTAITLNRATGVILALLGSVILAVNYLCHADV